ncbi:DUF6492 family protein [Paenibacillus doosanensis]|uniref:Glycosyltransferase n=1 Tax=Paenibacillus konkukensis TaxID=2020716 RepID=A0ABY4RW76_9BACL|nr:MULTISPECIES: DUF6492 family protein [Paenibacillus]MCS7460844.1 DUF6492 family protein [Paenibacillus doosanensis]UQZ86258.1 hypothetical protein SK3146_05551 [Paenibacillus konkukensis]
MSANRDIKIDIVIPAIPKDLATLPYVIDSVRKHVKHPIGNIFVVSPDSPRIKDVCRRKHCRFVHENSVLPLRKDQIAYRSKRWERSGWLYQQLLKLGSSSVTEQRYYLVIDADTVMIRPHRFRVGGKSVFYCRGWSQPEYFASYRRLLGKKAPRPRSFVAHYMMFDKVKLQSLKNTIQSRHGTAWYKAILKSVDRTKQFGFSEFETYGNYVYTNESNRVRMLPALNKSLSSSPSALSKAKLGRLASRYRSLSFHKRKGYSLRLPKRRS